MPSDEISQAEYAAREQEYRQQQLEQDAERERHEIARAQARTHSILTKKRRSW